LAVGEINTHPLKHPFQKKERAKRGGNSSQDGTIRIPVGSNKGIDQKQFVSSHKGTDVGCRKRIDSRPTAQEGEKNKVC